MVPQTENRGNQFSIRLITKLRMDGNCIQPKATIQPHLLLNPSHSVPNYRAFCISNLNGHISSHFEGLLC